MFGISQFLAMKLDRKAFLHLSPHSAGKRTQKEEVLHPLNLSTEDASVVSRNVAPLQLMAGGQTVMYHSP
jgi:hypothetical protein